MLISKKIMKFKNWHMGVLMLHVKMLLTLIARLVIDVVHMNLPA